MGERLREVAEHPASRGVVLLRQQTDVVAQHQQPFEKGSRFLTATDQGQVVGQPERAHEEHAFLAGQTIVGVSRVVTPHEAVFGEFLLDGIERADDSLV